MALDLDAAKRPCLTLTLYAPRYREIKRLYRVDQNPDVRSGKVSEQEAFANFIASFEPDFLNREANVKDSKVRTRP